MPDITLHLNLDQPLLALRRVRSSSALLIAAMDTLTGGATYAIEIRPILGGAVAADLIAAGKPRFVLKVPGPIGEVELARLNPADFAVVSEGSPAADVGWSATLALTTAQLRAFFADGAQQKFATLEITHVTTSGGALKPLYLVSFALLAGYLAPEADAVVDDDNTVPKYLLSVTTHDAMRALAVAGYASPKPFVFLIADQMESWVLRAKAVSGEDDDDVSFVQSSDPTRVFVKAAVA